MAQIPKIAELEASVIKIENVDQQQKENLLSLLKECKGQKNNSLKDAFYLSKEDAEKLGDALSKTKEKSSSKKPFTRFEIMEIVKEEE